MQIIVRQVTRKSKDFIMTLPNTPEGHELLASVRQEYKAEGKLIRVYGRGSRKAAFLEAAQDPTSWEHGALQRTQGEWKPYWLRHYRPKIKLKACTRFDVYFR